MSDHSEEENNLLGGLIMKAFYVIVPLSLIIMMGYIGWGFLVGGGHKRELPAYTVAGQGVTLEMTGNDALQFSTKELRAKSGQEVTIKFSHVGQLPKISMGHNVVILNADVDVAAFAAKCIPAAATDYMPTDADTKAQVLAQTKLLGGGESDEITFTAPAAGEYPFICTFPGHSALMNGKFIVD